MHGVLHRKDGYEFAVGWTRAREISFFDPHPDRATETYIAIGKGKKVGNRHLFARVGLGRMKGERKVNRVEKSCAVFTWGDCDTYDIKNLSSLGIPIDVGTDSGKNIGFGIKLHIFISRNPITSFKITFPMGGNNAYWF